MPACGKSVTGVILAKSLKMNFIDADLLIQERAGKSLQDIINADGIETFKSIEEEVLNAINVKNTVIATGGSAVYYDSAMPVSYTHLDVYKRQAICSYRWGSSVKTAGNTAATTAADLPRSAAIA